MLSARNQFEGTVKEINQDGIMAEVVVNVGDVEVVSIITRASLMRMRIAVGDTVRAVVKSTDVMIDK